MSGNMMSRKPAISIMVAICGELNDLVIINTPNEKAAHPHITGAEVASSHSFRFAWRDDGNHAGRKR